MPKGYYNILHNPEMTELIAEPNVTDGSNIPEDQQNLALDFSNTIETIRLLYGEKTLSFKKCFDQLFLLAKVGLEGDNAQPTLAVKALLQFKKEIVDKESGRVKNKYLKKLGVAALIFGLPALLVGMTLNYVNCSGIKCNCVEPQMIASMFILWAGTMIGVWLSFAITHTTISFDDLAFLEADRLEPVLRLIFTGVLSIVLALLFVKKALTISLGTLSSSNIANDAIVAFVIGVILGLNEKLIGSYLRNKTSALFNA